MTPLSPHFSLEEFIQSQTAARRRIDNTPPQEVVDVLRGTTAPGMEKVREILGGLPIHVSSGFRCERLNKAIGGAAQSAHIKGYGCDFNCFRFGAPLEICRKLALSGLPFDQLIEEGTWTHISFDPRLRQQVLTKAPMGGYVAGLRP